MKSKLKSKLKSKKLKAFTLMDLLVALIILGVIVMIALPNLMPLISKAKSTEAQLQLEHLFTLEKNYFYLHSKYSSDFSELSYEPAKTVSEDGNANYVLEVTSATNNSFRATATSITDFDGDGVFNVWEVDQDKKLKEVTPD
jgi:type IV pilus assembly protein PilE